jgi:hypothetical protein
MNIVKERLRRKAEANAAARASAPSGGAEVPVNTTGPAYSDEQLVEEFASILTGGKKNNKKQTKK